MARADAPPTRASVIDAAFQSAQRAGVTAASRALAQSAARIASGTPELAALLRDRQDGAERLAALTRDLARIAGTAGAASETEQARLARAIDARRADQRDLDAQIAAAFPEFRELTDPAPLSVAGVQAVLDADEALLFTLTDTDFTYVWAISKTAADWHRADGGTETRGAQVRQLRAGFSAGDDARAGIALKPKAVRPTVAAFPRDVARTLYRDLFAPLEHVFADAAHVLSVVDGPLASLPLGVLPVEPPSGRDDDPQALRDTAWMLRRHALTTLPNVSALKVLRFARARAPDPMRARDPFVGFGDPRLGYRLAMADAVPVSADAPVVTRGVYENVTQVADLTPLPNTARELRRLATVTGAGEDALFLGDEATETNVKSADLSRTRIVAFATHGLLADGLPGLDEPALVFTPPAVPDATDDALLMASEAAALKLSADLVILSACDTAGSDGTPGAEGLSGLARAFLYAGARAILVSHWPVDDYAASVLTTGMLTRMAGDDPRTRAEALQAASLALIDDTSNPRLAHPRLWAPFVVVGEGGRDIR